MQWNTYFQAIRRCASVFLVYQFVSERKRQVLIEQTQFLSTVFLCGEFKLENIFSGVHFLGKILAVIFICGNLFLWITEKTPKLQKLETLKIL